MLIYTLRHPFTMLYLNTLPFLKLKTNFCFLHKQQNCTLMFRRFFVYLSKKRNVKPVFGFVWHSTTKELKVPLETES